MRLEFKYGKLGIKGMNKMLYEDFTAFASTPKQRSDQKSSMSHYSKPPLQKAYKEFFKNKKVLKSNHPLEKETARRRVNPKFVIEKDLDSSALLLKLQNILS